MKQHAEWWRNNNLPKDGWFQKDQWWSRTTEPYLDNQYHISRQESKVAPPFSVIAEESKQPPPHHVLQECNWSVLTSCLVWELQCFSPQVTNSCLGVPHMLHVLVFVFQTHLIRNSPSWVEVGVLDQGNHSCAGRGTAGPVPQILRLQNMLRIHHWSPLPPIQNMTTTIASVMTPA